MRYRHFSSMSVLIVVAGLTSVTDVVVTGQARDSAVKPAAAKYTAPRTPDGQPDLQGIWTNNAATPLERPKVVADKAALSDAELAAVQKRAAELFTGGCDAAFGDSVFTLALGGASTVTSTCSTGNYNHFWLADRWFDRRTSLVIDPPDGRIPPYTPEAQKQQDQLAARRKDHPADGPEDRNLFERCISTSDTPNLLAGYNSNFQIFQVPGYVVIQQELIHHARIIPIDGRPHLDKGIKLLLGDSRGRWEGDTLVVDTTNFSARSRLRGASENLHLVERYTRISADTVQYEFTATDPTTWTRPWTARLLLKSSPDKLYEYACHEGNLGLLGILAGHREEERRGQSNEAATPRR
jgi:hypothetical protein